jgi:hypothetical protein
MIYFPLMLSKKNDNTMYCDYEHKSISRSCTFGVKVIEMLELISGRMDIWCHRCVSYPTHLHMIKNSEDIRISLFNDYICTKIYVTLKELYSSTLYISKKKKRGSN